MKKVIFLFAGLILSISTASANPYYYGPQSFYPAYPNYLQETPASLLENGVERLQIFIKQKGINDPEVLTAFLNEQIAPYFDFDRMAQMVGGRYYYQLNNTNQIKFKAKLQKLFFSALGRNLGAYANPMPHIDFLPARTRGPNKLDVPARVISANSQPVRLVFRFHKSASGWKIYDASSNGMSAVLYYRKYLLEQVRRYGPQALIN